jgi:amino acid transporter
MTGASVSETAAASTPTQHLGERRLTTLHAIGQSLAIGPIFSAGVLSGLIAGAAGFNTPLSVLFGMIGALGLAYVVSVFARRYTGAGAIYEYLVRGASPDVGVLGAGIYSLGLMFLGGGGGFIAIGFLTQGFCAAHLTALDGVPWWVWGAIGLAIATGLNHFGVRIAVRGVLVLAGLSSIPFIVLAIAIIVQGGDSGNTLSVFDPGQTSWNSVFNGILFAVTLFIGFEAAASIGEETHNPKRSIPIAVLGCVAISGAFYLLVTYAATVGFGAQHIGDWPPNPSPMGALAQRYVGSGLSTIVDLVIIFDAMSVMIAFTVATSRVLFALGRDGLLPRGLARTTARNTPLGGNVVVVVAGVAFLLFAGLTNLGGAVKLPDEIEAFTITAGAGSFLIELVYFMLAVTALRIVWRMGASLWWRIPVVILGGAAPVLAYKGSLDPWPSYPNSLGIILALVCMGVSVVWWAIVRARHPDRIRQAAAYAEAHHDVPPLDETLDYRPQEA